MSTRNMGGAPSENKNHLLHGFHGKRVYNIWKGMKARCYTKTSTKYKNYGARGIKLCPEWEHDAKAFCEWAMQNGYSDELTIDRINVDGDYSPQNCRWVDLVSQANNRSNNVMIQTESGYMTMADFCRSKNLKYKAFHKYYRTEHCSIEEAISKAKKER